MPARPRKNGEFCWINMLTPQPAQAREFFAKLLGWSYVELPGIGHTIQVDGHDIGGLFDLHSPQTPPGTPPHIGVMVKVASADAMSEKVTALGGRALPPFDVMEHGRMAVCFDPIGANIDLWEPKSMPGTEVDTMLHGAPSWFEAITSDVDRATTFYSQLFGWQAQSMPMPEFTYTTFQLDDQFVGGMMPVLPHMGQIPSHWGVYFTVRDPDDAARLAAELDATVCIPPQDIPNVGRFAGITSPQGVMFYVIRYMA